MCKRSLIAVIFILLVFAENRPGSLVAAPAAGARTVFIVHDGGGEELPFEGFHTTCAGYGPDGVKYTTPAGPVAVAWTDVAYLLPQWEEGYSVSGASFKTEALRPASCSDGYARRVVRKTVTVKKKEKIVEEETRYPLHSLHIIAFHKEGLENGQRALGQKHAVLDPGTGAEFVLVKGGCFERGDSIGEGGENERHVQRVCVDDFSIAKYETSQALWRSVMNANPSVFGACGPSCPVENVTWYDVQDFLRLLKQRTGRNYRLPTEAEWEYAARSGGRKEKWAGTGNESALKDHAWYNDNGGNRTHPVGAKNPNIHGLYDMSGNVAEWTADRYDKDYYRSTPPRNPPGPPAGDHRVSRGGGFRNGPDKVRTGFRDNDSPGSKSGNVGFRLVLQ